MPKIDKSDLFDYNRSPKRHQPNNISGPIDQGWMVSPDYPDKSGFYNASLSFQEPGKNNQISRVGLFVNRFDFSISLSGSSAQSHQINQFYAHNINTPELMVTCQARSQFEYSYIAEFIRMTQVYLTTNFHPGNENHGLVRFFLDPFWHEKESKNSWKNKVSLAVRVENDYPQELSDDRNKLAVASNGNHMGGRKPIDMQCYITSVSRLAEVGQNAYEFQFGIEFYDVVDNGGLPFSTNIKGIHDSVDGIQWTYEEIDLHQNDKTFVGPSDIKIKMPHQNKKSTGAKTPTKASLVETGIGDIVGDVSGSLVSAIARL